MIEQSVCVHGAAGLYAPARGGGEIAYERTGPVTRGMRCMCVFNRPSIWT